MSYLSVRICLLFLSITLLSACSMSAKILSPQANEELQGAAGFVVKLDSGADASTLNVTLDGMDITQDFSPRPFQAGTTLTAEPPVLHPIDGSDQHYIHATAQWAGASSGPQGMGINFLATALCIQAPGMGAPNCTAQPPYCLATVNENTNHNFTIKLSQTPANDLSITVTPSDNKVVLNNQPGGDPITVTVPANRDEATFGLRGETPTVDGYTELTLTGQGCRPNFCRIFVR